MTLDEAIAGVAIESMRPCAWAADGPERWVQRMLDMAETEHGHAWGVIHGAHTVSPEIVKAQLSRYYRAHAQSTAEWREFMSTDYHHLTVPGKDASPHQLIIGQGEGEVLFGISDEPSLQFRIRGEPPFEGHRLIIEQKRTGGDAK